jgi:hypothetical protein
MSSVSVASRSVSVFEADSSSSEAMFEKSAQEGIIMCREHWTWTQSLKCRDTLSFNHRRSGTPGQRKYLSTYKTIRHLGAKLISAARGVKGRNFNNVHRPCDCLQVGSLILTISHTPRFRGPSQKPETVRELCDSTQKAVVSELTTRVVQKV